jgi:hypothetical protein
VRCFKTADGQLNHFEFKISKDQAEVFATDYEDPSSLRQIARIENLDLPFERGYVHIQHAQYNANKDGNVTRVQTYRWDNVGFDGPTYPTARGYDLIPERDTGNLGSSSLHYGLDLNADQIVTMKPTGVDLSSAVRATVNFNMFTTEGRKLEYRANGHDWRELELSPPGTPPDGALRTYSVEIPLDEIVNGENTFDFRVGPGGFSEGIGNVDLTIDIDPEQ